jgi:hypothetical protein
VQVFKRRQWWTLQGLRRPPPSPFATDARYRHAALSAVRLAGDINATVTDGLSLDELLVKIKDELRKLGPLIDLEAIREQQVVENRLPATANGSEAG